MKDQIIAIGALIASTIALLYLRELLLKWGKRDSKRRRDSTNRRESEVRRSEIRDHWKSRLYAVSGPNRQQNQSPRSQIDRRSPTRRAKG
jgi:hypothetical protein